MYRFLILTFSIFHFSGLKAQYTVSGIVSDLKNKPLAGVSISVKDSYSGATTETDGSFGFQFAEPGPLRLVFSVSGYKTVEKDLIINGPLTSIKVLLHEEITEMKAVMVNAGLFEAGDKKRSTVLKSIDMVTTAGQQADIVAALKTLPGAQQIGEQEGLFVRGGTGAETKVFMDGMMVTNPFFTSVPGIAQRSRYSPLLFKGTAFSSGGYSAQWGQALSAVLLLESIDLPSRSEINLILSSAQQSIMGQRLSKSGTASTGFSVNYSNLAPYFSIVKQKYSYKKAPETINAEWNFRKKWKSGIFKVYVYANDNRLTFSRPGLDFSDMQESFALKNHHIFSNATLSIKLKNKWQWYTGTSVSLNHDIVDVTTGNHDTTVVSFYPRISNQTLQVKSVLTKSLGGLTKIYIGVEQQLVKDGIEAPDSIRYRSVTDNFTAAFGETDIYYSSKLVSKIGMRYEYSSLLNKMHVSPRISVAYKLNNYSQFSFAYGIFYQKPESNYLLKNSKMEFTRAIHYILNFQRVHQGRTLRAEAFYKKYTQLVSIRKDQSLPANEGMGFANGVEFFWRDKSTVKNLDYWISYSFLDTKRKYLDYPGIVQPSFAAKHTVSLVAKRFFSGLSTQFSATYNFATGRPYFNPFRPLKEFMMDKTISYNSLGLQANYLRSFGKVNAVFIVNVSNVLGTDQVYGYRYASLADTRGGFASEAITPIAKRFVFAGVYLSIGSDRRKEILD